MAHRITWVADAELTELLRRYYQGEAELWGELQARVHAELRAKNLPVEPRHLRFRRTADGYEVIVEDAANYARD